MFMSKYSKQVYAFDPYEPVLKRFRNMIRINNIKNIKIFPVGLGNKKQKLMFYQPPDQNHGLGTFVKGRWKETKKYIPLYIEVGDTIIEKNNINRIDLIKIDIEGYEKLAMRGLKKSLFRFRPIVMMELHPVGAQAFKNEEELYELFPENYNFYIITGNQWTGNYNLKKYNYISIMANVLAVPAEKDMRIPKKRDIKTNEEWKCPICNPDS